MAYSDLLAATWSEQVVGSKDSLAIGGQGFDGAAQGSGFQCRGCEISLGDQRLQDAAAVLGVVGADPGTSYAWSSDPNPLTVCRRNLAQSGCEASGPTVQSRKRHKALGKDKVALCASRAAVGACPVVQPVRQRSGEGVTD